MNISMNMNGHEVEGDVSTESEYSEEVMFAGWNPDISLLMSQQQSRVLAEEQSSLPPDLAMEDAGLFLQKMYSYQC